VRDRGLCYGDGLFETVAVADGQPLYWERHRHRLAEGCARLGLPVPGKVLDAEAAGLCAGRERAVLRVTLTRGEGGRGYEPPRPAAPTRVLSLLPWPQRPGHWRSQGVRVVLCRQRLAQNPTLAGLKHLNRLEQVLARAEWDDEDIAEGLMLDPSGRLVEGTMSNLFLVRDGCLRTPELSCCGVAGIIRSVILELADTLNIPRQVNRLELSDLAAADEVFLTNSVIGLWPVSRIDGRALAVGPLTRRLASALSAHSGGRWYPAPDD